MSEVVQGYYDEQVETEWARLERPYRRFEMVSTLRLIDETFPKQGRVADIGGGPGRYSMELLRRGYRTTLVDLSPKAIAFAKGRFAEAGLVPEDAFPANACDLSSLPSASFDAGLLLGPLYHIVEVDDRRRALQEFHRILKPGAPGIVGFINPWGVLRSGLFEFPSAYHDYDGVADLLKTWIQVGEQEAFTEAAFLTPPQALDELRCAGFSVETRAGVEAFAAGMHQEVADLYESDPDSYQTILRLVAETCQMPAYRDCTEHLHVVVRRIDTPSA